MPLPRHPASDPEVHLNLHVRGKLPSATVALNERCSELRAQGREIFRLGLGQSPFPVPEPVVEALRASAHEKDYLPVKGLPALREAIARSTHAWQGLRFEASDVLVGPGSKELMFLLQLVYYGDLVIPTPTWVSYAPQAELVGHLVRWVPTERDDDFRLSAEALERLCAPDPRRPRIVILNYPNNPTGGTYGEAELEAIAEVARNNRVILLSDEIYGKLHYEGAHRSIAAYYPEGTIVSSGLSKWCGAGGWRLGHFCFPPGLHWLRDAMATAASETYTSTSAPIQHAAVRAYQEDDPYMDAYLDGSRRVLRALALRAREILLEGGAWVVRPEGAFYLFADFEKHREALAARGIHGSRELCARLLEETGVAILPGEDFGREARELTARLALVDFEGAAALDAVAERSDAPDEAFLEEHCGRVIEAMRRIASWCTRTAEAAASPAASRPS